MDNRLVRDLLIFVGLFIIALLAKMEIINALISIWAGIWTMIRLFKLFFGSTEISDRSPAHEFIPNPHSIVSRLAFGPARKQTLLILTWWVAGIATTIVIYKLLNAILISP